MRARRRATQLELPGSSSTSSPRAVSNSTTRSERDGADRLENLDELINAGAAAFAADARNHEDTSLSAFWRTRRWKRATPRLEAGSEALQFDDGAFGPKAIEFDSVFVSELEEGLFPP